MTLFWHYSRVKYCFGKGNQVERDQPAQPFNLILSQLPRLGEVFSDICSGFIKLGGQNFVYTHLKFTGILWYWVPEAEVTRQFEMCNFDFCFKSFHGVNFINVLRNWRHMFVEYSLDQSMLKFSELQFFEWHVYDILVH